MKLQQYLSDVGMTAREFSRRIRVAEGSVCRYLNGDRFPEPAVLIRIKAVTDGAVCADDFLPSDEEAAA